MIALILLLMAILVQTTWVDPASASDAPPVASRRATPSAEFGALRSSVVCWRSPSRPRLRGRRAAQRRRGVRRRRRPIPSRRTSRRIGDDRPRAADRRCRSERRSAASSRRADCRRVPGRFVVTDTGLVFHSADGRLAQTYPLIGPVRLRDGRRWRTPRCRWPTPTRRYGRLVYVFRVDGGVFGTEAPGPLLDVAERPQWLDSLASREWRPRPAAGQSAGHGRDLAGRPAPIERSAYADTLYALFGRPGAPAGLVSSRGPHGGATGRVHRLPRLARARSGADEQRGAAPARDGARAGPPVAGARPGPAPHALAGRRAGSRIPAATATTRCRSTRRRRSRSRSISSRPPRPASLDPAADAPRAVRAAGTGHRRDGPLPRPPADLRPPSPPPDAHHRLASSS